MATEPYRGFYRLLPQTFPRTDSTRYTYLLVLDMFEQINICFEELNNVSLAGYTPIQPCILLFLLHPLPKILLRLEYPGS